jgi:hypothetical protein
MRTCPHGCRYGDGYMAKDVASDGFTYQVDQKMAQVRERADRIATLSGQLHEALTDRDLPRATEVLARIEKDAKL